MGSKKIKNKNNNKIKKNLKREIRPERSGDSRGAIDLSKSESKDFRFTPG